LRTYPCGADEGEKAVDYHKVVPADHAERHRWMEMLVRASIAFQVRSIRLARGWTQQELANRSSLSLPTIGRLEDMAGESPSIATLLAVAKAFDCGLVARFTDWQEFVDRMIGMIPPKAFDAAELQREAEIVTAPECEPIT
jgi:transcriptional regulator with XRE-family HTH domain